MSVEVIKRLIEMSGLGEHYESCHYSSYPRLKGYAHLENLASNSPYFLEYEDINEAARYEDLVRQDVTDCEFSVPISAEAYHIIKDCSIVSVGLQEVVRNINEVLANNYLVLDNDGDIVYDDVLLVDLNPRKLSVAKTYGDLVNDVSGVLVCPSRFKEIKDKPIPKLNSDLLERLNA